MEEKEMKIEQTEELKSETTVENANAELTEEEKAAAADMQEDTPENEESEQEPEAEQIEEKVDWLSLSKEKIVEKVKKLINENPVEKIKDLIDAAKAEFYKKHNEELQEKKNKFIQDGGKEEDYKPQADAIEVEFKQYMAIYRQKRHEYIQNLEQEKLNNLKEKQNIIEQIKELVKSTETMNKTFEEFRELQKRFNEIGNVPVAENKKIWNNYHTAVEIFYDYVKINRELRDLDLKKNLETKLKLIERVKALLEEEDVVEAHKKLQELHKIWRETGPVPKEKKDEIWEEFSANTKILNKKHQEYYDKIKLEKEENLRKKEALCEKIEQIDTSELKKLADWNKKTEEITQIQEEWKKIGPTPKNTNSQIFKRFRAACDIFFDKRKEFFNQIKKEQQQNLQKKYEICEKAEELKDSSDWKATTDELIRLQKLWKEIGPVPRKKSDAVWNRFRAACDHFFNRKAEAFSGQKEEEEKNLKLKEEIIEKLENFVQSENIEETIQKLKEFQDEWKKIGFVPIKMKNEIQNKFRSLINKHYDNLKTDVKTRDELRYKSKLEGIAEMPNAMDKLRMEKDRVLKKMAQTENDKVLLENNIGFFNNSKNAESLLANVRKQIKQAEENLERLKNKLKLINQQMNQLKNK